MTDTYKQIKKRCEKLGISVSELCRQTSPPTDRDFMDRLRKKEPKSIIVLKEINKTLEKLERKKKK